MTRVPLQPLLGLQELEAAADQVNGSAGGDTAELASLRGKQFELWRQLRLQGNPWLVTDFVSLGTPMYFADLLYTKDGHGSSG